MDIAIIEDEPLMLEALEDALQALDNSMRVVARLNSVKQALNFFEKKPAVDLIFSDIKLGDGNSFNIFEVYKPSAPVVFCTAFDSYALEAFKANGLHYILKPYETEDIRVALNKYKSFTGKREIPGVDWKEMFETLYRRVNKNPDQQRLLVHQGEQIIPLTVSDIALVSSGQGIGYVHTFSEKRYQSDHTLDKLGKILGASFYRLNRQHLINRTAIEKVSQYFARKLKVQANINYPEALIVSKANASSFLKWLEEG